jgi:hypothetical protein
MARKRVDPKQRKALREWYFSQNPRPSQRACCTWFFDKYKHKISQSTVSESLNDHFRFVDQPDSLALVRQGTAQWPILESILSEWEQKITAIPGNVVSGELLVEKARLIWSQIPQYQNLPRPEFSQGWLTRFKARHEIRKRKRHGEAASLPKIAIEEMKSVQTICGEYSEEDVYNMDETGLFWRRALSDGLSSQSIAGIKKDKSRISLVVCTNCTGSDRFPLWFIGHAKTPRALRGVNVTALGGVWTSNNKAWMRTNIMVQWLQAFYRHIGSRNVMLCMDNFSAHISGVEEAPPPSNIRIIWLPANSTSHFQPLDQGIIQNLKLYYRKQWLAFIINQFEHEIDPYASMTVYHTIRWCIRAWRYDVTNATIYNCFRKSTIIEPSIQNLPQPPEPDLLPLYQQAQQAGRIQDAMNLSNFLNPTDENEFIEAVTLEEIMQQHLQSDQDEAALLEDVEPSESIRIPTNDEALIALQTLFQFQEHQEETKAEDIRYLEKLEKAIQRLKLDSQQQTTLDRWIM